MRRSRKLWLLGVVAGIAAVLVGGLFMLLGTESGTRWLLRQASDYLPPQLQIEDPTGSLLYGLHVRSLEWRDDAVHVTVRQLALDVELAPLFAKRIAINKLDAGSVDVQVLASGDGSGDGSLPDIDLPVGISIADASVRNVTVAGPNFARSVDRIGLAGRIVGSNLGITRLAVRSDWLVLDVTGRATTSGAYPHNAKVTWEWQQSAELRLAGHLLLSGTLGEYDVQHSLTSPVALSTSGTVRYESGALFADLLNRWAQIEWVLGERTVSSSGGTLSLKGDTTKFALALDAVARTNDIPSTRITLQGVAGREGMRIADLDLASSLGRLAATGDVDWLPVPAVELTFALSELDPEMALARIVKAVGLRGSVKGSYADGTFTLANGLVQVGRNRARATGSIGENIVLDAELDVPAVDELAPGTTGSLKAGVRVDGPGSNPNIRANIGGQLGIGDTVLEAIAVSASGNLAAHSIRAELEAAGNKVEVAAAGGYAQDGWRGTVSSLAITNPELGRWANRQPATLAALPDVVSLSRVCLQGSSTEANACLAFDYRNDGTASLEASIAQLPLAALPFRPPPNVSISGFVEAELRGELNDRGLTGNASLELLETAASTTFEDEVISATVASAVSRATITDNRVESTTQIELADGAGSSSLDFTIDDATDIQSAIQASGTVAISDVSLFAVFVPGITNPRGSIEGSISATGNLGAPEFSGEVALQNGSFGVRQAGLEIHKIDVLLQQQSVGRLLLAGSARSGEGVVAIQGSTTLGRDTGMRADLTITGSNFELVRLPDAAVAASPSITVVLDDRAALVTGKLAIPTANLRIDDIPETAVSPSPDATVHSSAASAAPVGRRIDVKISTLLGDDVHLDAFGLKTRIEGTVKIEGGSHKPYLGFGRLSLREGRYKAYGQELTIERGELIFNGPLDNPNLDVRATRSANDVVAGIQLTGTPSQLRSTLYSEPALGDAEILSYLLTGRALSSSTTATEGDALNNAAFALGLAQAGSITSQIRGSLGLETLTVEGGAEDGRIVAGKRFGDRLLVEYGYGLIDKLGTLLLRYQLSERLVLESRTGTVSNLDILYRVKKQ